MQIESDDVQLKKGLNLENITLDMYDIPPVDDYRLSRLAKVCENRIRLYKKMENFLDDYRDDNSEKKDFYKKISQKLKAYEFKNLADDLYSHWICHLVFHDNDLGYYTMQENFIFSGRLYSSTRKIAEQKLAHINQNDDKKEPYIKRYQRQYFFDFLVNYLGKDPYSKSMFQGEIKKTFVEGEVLDPVFDEQNKELLKLDSRRIEIPFKYCSKLIKEYQIELRKGKALIHPNSCFMVISELFQNVIFINDKRLKPIYNQIKEEDDRISTLVECLKDFNKNYTEHYFEQSKEARKLTVKPESINTLSNLHFPLCMKEILRGFRKKHMLKHWGRLQLGIFLKGIGMKMSDNITLFEHELRKTPQGEKKINEYKYYIEHMYGKRGKKTDYTPWSCSKVANKAIPGKDEYFGCPYKYYSDEKLGMALETKLSKGELREVFQVPKENYSLRCRKVYQLTHPEGRLTKGIGRHPNSYYLASYFNWKKKQTPTQLTNLTATPQDQQN